MEAISKGQAVLTEIRELMEKTGFDSVAPVLFPASQDDENALEAALINLKTLNAKYDKNEAVQQIRCLMDKYNIQLDQLMDRRGII